MPGAFGPFEGTTLLATSDGGKTWQPQVVADIGGGSGNIAATFSRDYLDVTLANGTNQLFATANGGLSAQRTTLQISLAHQRLTTRALARAGHRIVINGHVSPVLSADERVAITTTDSRGRSRLTLARVATDGSFHLRLAKVSTSLDVVAQVLGDGVHGGAGTPVVHFTLTH